MKQLIYKLAKKVALMALKQVYDYMDKDDNGELSKKEIDAFIADIRKLATKIKKK